MLGVEEHAIIARVLGAGTSFADAFNLFSSEPDCQDQGQTEFCFAHSASACMATVDKTFGLGLGYVPSPRKLGIATLAMWRGATTPAGQAMPSMASICNNGADDTSLFAALARYGTDPMGPLVDGRYSDASPENVGVEPTLADLEADKPVIGPYSVDPQAPNLEDAVCATLQAGIPIWTGAWCGPEEMNYTANSAPIGVPGQSSGGGHATLLDGWEKGPNGSRLYWKKGSWGAAYGIQGRCQVTSEWLRAAWWLYPFSVTQLGRAR